MEVVMKKQNNIIADLESRTEALGGTVEVVRYDYIRIAHVKIEFGQSHMMVALGPHGAMKYCSWFISCPSNPLIWSVHHDEPCFTGKRNAKEVEWFFAQARNSFSLTGAREAA
jgi:hypothetical protein|tara:strand:+ start:640 stop:978 length:339 start_codon:yes stop_codon:yes gene_type:complete